MNIKKMYWKMNKSGFHSVNQSLPLFEVFFVKEVAMHVRVYRFVGLVGAMLVYDLFLKAGQKPTTSRKFLLLSVW